MESFSPPDTNKALSIIQSCRRLETEILMHTARGDFNLPFVVPEDLQDKFGLYLADYPEVERTLRDPQLRLRKVRDTVYRAMSSIKEHEEGVTQSALDQLLDCPGVIVYGPHDAAKRAGLVAFNIEGIDHQVVAYELNKRGIEIRNGPHCASLAHHYLGIKGSARLSFYVYTTKDEVNQAVAAVSEIAHKLGRK